jgi:hypothetical protein
MSRRILPVLFLLSALLMGTFACRSPQPVGTNQAQPEASPPAAAPQKSLAAGKIGVPECDDYLAKVDACIAGKVPAAARAQFNAAVEQNRKAWQQAASTPQGKASLAAACKQATEAAKTAYKSYNCTF